MAKSGMPPPQHRIVDTLSLAQNCVRASRSYKLEDLAVYFGVAESEDHRGLSDSRLVARVFHKIVSRTMRLQTVSDLMGLSRPMSFEDTVMEPGDLPPGFECLAEAIEERRTVLLVYDGGTKGTAERRVTPRGIVMSGGRSYLCAFCHADGIEKSFRLERIRRFRVDEA